MLVSSARCKTVYSIQISFSLKLVPVKSYSWAFLPCAMGFRPSNLQSVDRVPQCISADTCMCHLQAASWFIPHHSYFCQHYKSNIETVRQQGFLVSGASKQIMNFKKSVWFTLTYFLCIKNFELVECRKLISYLKYSLFSPLDSATCGSCTIHTP